jgi:hypothetical protein
MIEPAPFLIATIRHAHSKSVLLTAWSPEIRHAHSKKSAIRSSERS